MIRSWLTAVFLISITSALPAAPRWHVPSSLKPGAVNEVYGWDDGPVPDFTVQVIREGQLKPLILARSFPMHALTLEAPNALFQWAAALVALDALDASGPVVVRIFSGGMLLIEVPSAIEARVFPVEAIRLDKEIRQLREKPDPRKDRQAAAIWATYLRFDATSAWSGGKFLLPVAPTVRLSAHFGDTRQYQYVDGTTSRDYHRGTDFAVPVGTPVWAAAPGVVVLAANRMLTGNTVVIEHAPGVYSVYFHLFLALVKAGDRVSAGEKVALSGATGLVTGPHLHWEVRVGGVPVDPLDLVSGGLLDTGAVGAVVSSIERPIH